MTSRTTITLACIAALTLTACSDSGTTATTVTTVTETTTAAAVSPAAETTRGPAPSATEQDPVFAAIDAVLTAHPDGIITDVDREDDRTAWDIEVVVGEEVIELELDDAGTIREEERENDDDDVAKARAATLTVSDALRQALEQVPAGVVDEAELEEDDGVLEWEIELDDVDGNDLTELTLPAN